MTTRQAINFLRRAVLARIPRQRLLFGWHGQVILPVGNPIRSTRASVLAHATLHLGAFVSLWQESHEKYAFGLILALVLVIGAGCQSSGLSEESIETLRHQALVSLKLAASTAPDPLVRVRALEGLRYAGAEVAGLWIRQGLYDGDPAVRSAALRGLADLRPTDSADAFDRWHEDSSPLVRAAALWPMRASDPARFGEQLRSLVLESPELRCQPEAFELLLSACVSATEEELRDWLAAADPQEAVFIRAVRGALVTQADARTMRELTQQARTGSSLERQAAIELLALSAEPDVLYILLECLEEGGSAEVRLAAARALGRLGSKAGLKLALRHLKQVPGSSVGNGGHRLGVLQVLACEACADIGDPRALAAMGDMLAQEQDPEIRASCAAAVLRLIELEREARR